MSQHKISLILTIYEPKSVASYYGTSNGDQNENRFGDVFWHAILNVGQNLAIKRINFLVSLVFYHIVIKFYFVLVENNQFQNLINFQALLWVSFTTLRWNWRLSSFYDFVLAIFWRDSFQNKKLLRHGIWSWKRCRIRAGGKKRKPRMPIWWDRKEKGERIKISKSRTNVPG